MKQVLCIFLVSLASSTFSQTALPAECVRLSYFFLLKQRTASRYWPGFNDKALFGPMMYYTSGNTYIINPNRKIKKKVNYIEVKNCIKQAFIGVLEGINDTTHFNMQVDYDENDSSALYFHNPIVSASDISISKFAIPEIGNIEEWIAMMLHGSFHLYQQSFTKFRRYYAAAELLFNRDTLVSFYKEIDWYKSAVEKEYDHLLHANNTNDKRKIIYYIENFLNSRQQRYKKIYLKYKINIKPLEDMLERSEGVARYMEYCMKRIVKYEPLNRNLLSSDTLYKFGSYRYYEIGKDPFINRLGNQYYYAIGLQLACLLERRGIDFRHMYRDNISFEKYLEKIRN